MTAVPVRAMPLEGWGRRPRVQAQVCRPESLRDAAQALTNGRLVLPRGAGRAYGDAALLDTGWTIWTCRLNRFLAFDTDTGVLRAEAGVTLDDVLKISLPRGWFLPVTPGTRWCTLGGCVAADVHGKNSHHVGPIGRFIEALTLLTPQGEWISCGPGVNRPLFLATLGGMGLTGLVVDVTLKLQPVTTAWIMQETVRTRCLSQTLETFLKMDSTYPYSVAWVDCLKGGVGFGRGVIHFGRHAERDELPRNVTDPLAMLPTRAISIPDRAPSAMLNRLTLSAFNGFWSVIHPTRPLHPVHCVPFFYPLDFLSDWNRAYSRTGFYQWQCLIPEIDARDVLTRLLRMAQDEGLPPYLSVLKRLGPSSQGYLSFPAPGYTFALDFPARSLDKLHALLDRMDDLVLDAGGRIYLAKDARLSADRFARMYPQLDTWKQVQRQIDPHRRMQSGLSRRLGLTEACG